MSLLFRVIYAAHCRGTHHKLAMDALRFLECDEADRWRNLVLKHHDAYLLGSKAPDTRFKDFRNHVLHVEQNYWGGAANAARLWFHRAVETLRQGHWVNGIYAAGVLSHYYTDPIHPFHTGQSEAENNIHRAVEWSISKAYDELWELTQRQGLPDVPLPDGDDWLEDMVNQGADFSHPHYQTLIDHYDFDRGRLKPPAGLNDVCRGVIVKLLGYAVRGWARLLDCVFEETESTPPRVSLSVPTFLATLEIPLQFVTKKLADSGDRSQIQAIYAELQESGRVEENLPQDDRVVRDLFYQDWPDLVPEKRTVEKRTPTSSTPSRSDAPPLRNSERDSVFHLEPGDLVEEAPSIGPKTAKRLQRIKIRTVQDLFDADAEETAGRLNAGHISADVIRDWQDQARLVCRVPHLRGHDAQILVACGYRDPLDISTAPPKEILSAAEVFSQTREGQWIVRSGKTPDEAEIGNWQSWAEAARDLKAA